MQDTRNGRQRAGIITGNGEPVTRTLPYPQPRTSNFDTRKALQRSQEEQSFCRGHCFCACARLRLPLLCSYIWISAFFIALHSLHLFAASLLCEPRDVEVVRSSDLSAPETITLLMPCYRILKQAIIARGITANVLHVLPCPSFTAPKHP